MLLQIKVVSLKDVLNALNAAAPDCDERSDPTPRLWIGVNGQFGVGTALADESPEPINTAWIQSMQGERIKRGVGIARVLPYRMVFYLRAWEESTDDAARFLVFDWADSPGIGHFGSCGLRCGVDMFEAFRISSGLRVEVPDVEIVSRFLRDHAWPRNHFLNVLNHGHCLKGVIEQADKLLNEIRGACYRGEIPNWVSREVQEKFFHSSPLTGFLGRWLPGGPLQPLAS